jgi:hypothetical protein
MNGSLVNDGHRRIDFRINLAPFTPKLCMVVYTFSPKKTENHVKQKHTQRFKIGHQLSTAQRETTGVLPT